MQGNSFDQYRQVIPSSAAPIGALIQMDMAPNYCIANGQEYLRSGNIVPYSASYSSAFAASLGVWGLPANLPAARPGSLEVSYGYIGGNYIAFPNSPGNPQYSADGITWASGSGAPGYPGTSGNQLTFATNGVYGVVSNAGNTAPNYSSNGTTWAAVGGTFTTFPAPSAFAFGNNIWVAGSTLNGTAGEQAYIAAANPAGTWTVGASTNIGMIGVKGYSYGNGVFVVCGISVSATSGKIATATTPAAGWTDRTSASGVLFGAGDSCQSPVFDGAYHWCLTASSSASSLLRSSDGISWTVVALPNPATATPMLTTDGAGRLIVTATGNTAGFARQPLFHSTSDGGATWTTGQYYVGHGLIASGLRLSYVNSVYFAGVLGTFAPLRLGVFSLAAPDYIGLQAFAAISYNVYGGSTVAPINPAHVRIK